MKQAGAWALRCASCFVCAATFLPFLRTGRWWVRALDFPRVQVAALGAVSGAVGLSFFSRLGQKDRALLLAAQAAVAVQMLHVLKYTRFFPKQALRATAHLEGADFSILTANVRTRNRRSDLLLELIKHRSPDIVLLLEPDAWWMEQLKPLHSWYPHRVLRPQENTYGLLLYSKLELVEPEVRFLVQEDIPSIRTRIRLPSGKHFWFYGLHPRPPVRGNLDGVLELDGSRPRDAELIVVASEIHDLREPVVIAGDFNDVAWSHTTRRFQRIGRLLDPRVGRGLFNTFHAQNVLFRFPLDHLFMSDHFSLVNFARERSIGSDHFPISARLQLSRLAEIAQEAPKPDEEDFHEAQAVVREAAAQQVSTAQ